MPNGNAVANSNGTFWKYTAAVIFVASVVFHAGVMQSRVSTLESNQKKSRDEYRQDLRELKGEISALRDLIIKQNGGSP